MLRRLRRPPQAVESEKGARSHWSPGLLRQRQSHDDLCPAHFNICFLKNLLLFSQNHGELGPHRA